MNLRGKSNAFQDRINEQSQLRRKRRMEILNQKRIDKMEDQPFHMEMEQQTLEDFYTRINESNNQLSKMYSILVDLENYISNNEDKKHSKHSHHHSHSQNNSNQMIQENNQMNEIQLKYGKFIQPLLIWLQNNKDIMLRFHIVTVFLMIMQIDVLPELQEIVFPVTQMIISQTNHIELIERTLRFVGLYISTCHKIEDYQTFIEIIQMVQLKSKIDKSIKSTLCWDLYFGMISSVKRNPDGLMLLLPYINHYLELNEDNIEGCGYLLHGIADSIHYRIDALKIFEDHIHFIGKLFTFMNSGVDQLVIPTIGAIKVILSSTDNYVDYFIQNNIVQHILTIFNSIPLDSVVNEMMDVVSLLCISKKEIGIQLIEKNIIEIILRYVYRIQLTESCIAALCTIIITFKQRQDILQILVEKNVIQPLVYCLRNVNKISLKIIVDAIDACLVILLQHHISPEIGANEKFEECGFEDIINVLLDCDELEGFTKLKLECMKQYLSNDQNNNNLLHNNDFEEEEDDDENFQL